MFPQTSSNKGALYSYTEAPALRERTKKSRRGGDPSGQMEPNRWASAIPWFNRSTVEPQAAFAPVLALDHSPVTDSVKIGAVVLDGSIEKPNKQQCGNNRDWLSQPLIASVVSASFIVGSFGAVALHRLAWL